MMSVDQEPAERLECKPWCSPKHYRFCGGPCCPHLHPADDLSQDAERTAFVARDPERTVHVPEEVH